MRMLFLICKSSTTLQTLKDLVEYCDFGGYTILDNNVLSINYDDNQGNSIEYIGIEPEDRDDVIYECGDDSEIYKEFYCNKDILNPSVFWVRYSLATPDAYLLKSVLKCFKNGKLEFLVNNGRHGNFSVDKFIESVIELI